ncbi:Cystathionine beta-lyase PatB [compost metagenome]
MKSRHGWSIDPAWVLFTPAVVPAIANAVQAFTAPGDQVVIQSPAYPPFHSVIESNGRIKLENELVLQDNRYCIDFADLERKLQDPRTRLLLLCNPHNPVGAVYTREELLQIGELCLRHGVTVVSDEIHADIVYDGTPPLPLCCLVRLLGGNQRCFAQPQQNLQSCRFAHSGCHYSRSGSAAGLSPQPAPQPDG